MENHNSNNFINNSPLHKETDSNKSFVKKVKSHVSGLLSSSLGKWFTSDESNKSIVRHRDDDDDDEECFNIQPPVKRVKMPSTESTHTYYTAPSTHKQNHFNVEPVAGPSGLQSKRQKISTICNSNHLLNGEQDSEGSESECSLLKLKSSSTNRDASPLGGPNRTLFNDRSLTPQLNTSLSSRRPSFNASTFGSPNFVDRTLTTKRILNSPFYKGRTIYGGASAYSSRQRQGAEQKTHKNQIQVKPVNDSVSGNDASLSKTARRILNALEEFRSPIADAKKIPPPVKRRPEGILTKYTGANPYLNREHKIPLALNKELHVPTVPDLLKMKLKERLQDSTVAVRQIATSSKSVLNKDDYRIRASEDETPKHSNKMKTKLTTTRQQKNNNQTVEEVKLPEIVLPITTLPKFDFSLTPPPSSGKQPLITVACNSPPKIAEPVKKKQEAVNSHIETQFKFSHPLVLAENLISIIAINDFKFSDPLFKQKERNMPADVSVNFKSSNVDSIPLKRKVQNVEVPQPAVKLSKTSIDELFNKSKIESLDKFKPATDMWECSVCLIRNKSELIKCAACETPKQSSNAIQKPVTTNSSASKKAATFGDQFKPPASTWECPSCMIRNKDEIDACIACETAKPQSKNVMTGFGDAFKKKESEWECPTCMVRNSDDKSTCLACETLRPGAKPVPKEKEQKDNVPMFNFGIFPPAQTSNAKDVAVLPLTTTTVATTIAPSLPVFSFGIPPKSNTSSEVLKKDTLPGVVVPVSKDSEIHLPKPLQEVKLTEQPTPDKKPEEPPKPIAEHVKPAVSTGGFSFGNFVKAPTEVVKSTPPPLPKPAETIKPIITGSVQSAFTFTPTAPSPSLKRAANDSENSITVKKDTASIIFSPPKVDVLVKDVAAAPQLNMLRQPEKNLFNIEKPTVSTQQPPATTSNTFSFSAPQTQPPLTTAPSMNLFNYGAKTTAPPLFGNTITTTTQAPVFKFAQPEQQQTNQNQTGFGVSEAPMFANSSAMSIFGTPKAFDPPAPAASFGSVAPTGFGTEVKQPPTFGTEQKTTPLPFCTTDIKSFSFGASVQPAEDVAKPPMFSFGPTVKAPEPAKPFSFGTPAAAPQPAPAGGFSFNSSSTPAPPTFNFNAPKVDNTSPFQSPPAANNIFNPAPLQPQPLQNGGFNFGGPANTNNNVKTGFNFGTANQFNSPPTAAPAAPNAGIFSFGNGSNPNMAQPTGGFNFGQSVAPAPAFNANIKPNYNFTSGNLPTGFSATPDSPQVAQRRRLKAVRRNPR